MWKLETDVILCPNRFPARGIGRSTTDAAGSWVVAYQKKTLNKYKTPLSPIKSKDEVEAEEKLEKFKVLSHDFLLQHHHVDDARELCSIDIVGEDLSEASGDFHLFTNVAYINAAENNLTVEAFKNFPDLKELEMPVNGVSRIILNAGDFLTLQVLDLSYNNLNWADVTSLSVIENIKVLSLTGNCLRQLPKNMMTVVQHNTQHQLYQGFSKLEVLNVDSNQISDGTRLFTSLAILPHLQELNVDNNPIETIPYLTLIEGRAVVVTEEFLASTSEDKLNKDESSVTPTEITDKINIIPSAAAAGEDNSDDVEADQAKDHPPHTTPADYEPEDFFEGADKVEPPFQNLRFLSMANNRVSSEDGVIAVAAWPMLKCFNLEGNPLVAQTNGEPPLLASCLHRRLGITIQYGSGVKKPSKPRKPWLHVPVFDKTRTITTKVRKVPKQPVEVLINSFRQLPNINADNVRQLPCAADDDATAHHRNNSSSSTSSSSSEHPDETDDQEATSVFLTQINEQADVPSSPPRGDSSPATTVCNTRDATYAMSEDTEPERDTKYDHPKYKGYEAILDAEADDSFDHPIGIQNNVKTLRYMLDHQRIYVQPSAPDLSKQVVAYEPRVHVLTGQKMEALVRHPVAPPTKQEKFESQLHNVKRQMDASVVTAKMTTKMVNSKKTTAKEARRLLKDVECKYKGHRIDSMMKLADPDDDEVLGVKEELKVIQEECEADKSRSTGYTNSV